MVPMISPADPVDREVGYMPTKAPYDPRWMLGGRQNPCRFLCCLQDCTCGRVFSFILTVCLFW